MSGTVRTIAFLQSSEFQDGQSAGSIIPGRVRDLISTLQSLTGSVATPEQYGAAGDGVTNDTTAFNSALANANVVIVGPKKYVCGNVIMNSGNALLGMKGYPVGDDNSGWVTNGAGRPMLLAPAGTTNHISVGTANMFAIDGIIFNGQLNAANGISDMSQSFRDTSIVTNCNFMNYTGNCIGGGSFGNIFSGYVSNCTFGSSGTGINGPDDMQIADCDFSSLSGQGINIYNGTGACSINGCRFEWSALGVNLNGAVDVSIAGCWTDSNTGPAFIIQGGANYITITGCANRFNGNAGTAGSRSHFYLNTCTHVMLAGNGGHWGNAGGANAPNYAIEFAGTNDHCAFTGNDFSNVGGTGVSIGTLPTNSRASGNLGLADF